MPRRKNECKVTLSGEERRGAARSGEEREFWMGTEAGMLEGYSFQGMVLGGDETDEAGRMGAGFCGLHPNDIKGCRQGARGNKL